VGHKERAPSGSWVGGSIGVTYLYAMQQLAENSGCEVGLRVGRSLVR
jgi:hypothetical protein